MVMGSNKSTSDYKLEIGEIITLKTGDIKIIDRFKKKNNINRNIKYYVCECCKCKNNFTTEERRMIENTKICSNCNTVERNNKEKLELINIMKRYLKEHDKFTNREFEKCEYTTTLYRYRRLFGSVENALRECGYKISKEKEWLYNREKYSKKELKRKLIYYLPKHLKTHLFLPTADEIDLCKELPSLNSYYTNFKSMERLYSEIGIDMKLFNKNRLKNDMKYKYKLIKNKINKIPSRIDLDNFCKIDNVYYYSSKSYCEHFGGMNSLHKIMGDRPTDWDTNKSNKKLLELLKRFYEDYNIVPTQSDLIKCHYMPNYSIYVDRFGSFPRAVELAGMTPRCRERKLKTINGNEVLSGYEYKFVRMLEKYNIKFKTEELYSKYIPNFKRKFRFDFTIFINEEIKFVEIFGIKGNEKYEARKLEKIKICKENNLKLICLSGDDVSNNSFEELLDIINN